MTPPYPTAKLLRIVSDTPVVPTRYAVSGSGSPEAIADLEDFDG